MFEVKIGDDLPIVLSPYRADSALSGLMVNARMFDDEPITIVLETAKDNGLADERARERLTAVYKQDGQIYPFYDPERDGNTEFERVPSVHPLSHDFGPSGFNTESYPTLRITPVVRAEHKD